jgi:3-oxoadipate enol-lactonase/4-carboxymuconolactone decarboxylase
VPFLNVHNTRLFYRLEGRSGRPVLLLSHSLGCDHGMWSPQMPELLDHFQVLRYDTRGDGLQIMQTAFCGLSMGGAIGQWLALHAPQRLTTLVLANTSPKFGTPELWNARRQAVLEGGMAAIADAVMQRFFSPENQASAAAQSTRAVLLGTNPQGYAACCAALRDADHRAELGRIALPALVIGSDKDPSTPWKDHGELLAREIPLARAVRLSTAHLSNLEQPRAFTAAVLEFLLAQTLTADPSQPPDPLETGMLVRRQVLGSEHVDRAVAGATSFNRDFQELITRYAWGSVWTRPGLDHRTRRLLVLAMTAALGRWEEFRLHLRAALANGLEPCDVKETLLQVAIYAGVPAANTAFQIAREEMEGHKPGESG